MNIKKVVIDWILTMFGNVYIWIERHKEYPNDNNILGMDVDKDLQNMSRKQLCRYMDAVLPQKGFFELQSTTKIRLGCQLLRNYHRLKENKKHTTFNSKTGEVKYDYDDMVHEDFNGIGGT